MTSSCLLFGSAGVLCEPTAANTPPSRRRATVADLKTRLSPRLRDLLVWNGGPRGLAVPLLLEFAAEGFFDVVHVEGADSRAGDAVDGSKQEDNVTESETRV